MSKPVQMTVRLPPEVRHSLRVRALEEHRTVQAVVEELIVSWLCAAPATPPWSAYVVMPAIPGSDVWDAKVRDANTKKDPKFGTLAITVAEAAESSK